MLKRFTASAIVIAALGACLDLEAPAPVERPQLVLHGVLDATADQQFVLLYQARTGVANAEGNAHDDPVAGALVTVTAPNGAVMVANERAPDSSSYPSGTYAYTPGRYGVRPSQGGTFRLFVRTPSGQVVTGETTMPVAPAMSSRLPANPFDRERDTLRLSWSGGDVPSYELVIKSYLGEYHTFFNSAVAVPGTALTIAGDQVLPGGTATIMVSAVDANYYDYYRAQSDPFAGTPPGHLTGAIGVFGSIAPLLITDLRVF